MPHDPKPPVDSRDDEEAFLTPPGQSGSLVDRLAIAQGWLPSLEPRDVEVQLELFIKLVLRGGRT